MMAGPLLLSKILSRRVGLEWYEAVAVVRGVTEQLLIAGDPLARIPELDHIELAADGSVAITGGVVAGEPLRRLGQLLQAVLTDAEVPVQLRLIVSQAVAPLPSYASVSEFDQALGFFERPDRAALLTALFVRAQAAEGVTGAVLAVTLDAIAPLPDDRAEALPTSRTPKHSYRLIGVAVAIGAVVALSTAAALYVPHAMMKVDDRTASRATAVADALGSAALAGLSAVSETVGLGRIVAADVADAVSSPAAGSLPVVARMMTREGRVAAVGEAAVDEPESAPPGPLVAYEILDDRAGLTDALAQPAGTTDPVADAALDSVIYTTGAAGVSPPVGVGAQEPRQRGAAADRRNLVRIELIVARSGSVESARLLSPRRHVLGGMLLSAAKTWEFHPATKDGVAVRFRKTILVSFE